jgi:molecular chaperone GrpE
MPENEIYEEKNSTYEEKNISEEIDLKEINSEDVVENKKNGKSFFKKKDDKNSLKIVELEKSNEELKDKYLRIVAEYDNYRRRTAKERLELSDNVRISVLLDFLPVVDDMDRAIVHLNDNSTSEEIAHNVEGIKLIAEKFHRFLKNYGIEEIEAIGEDFNVDLHEAVTKFAVPEEEKKGKVIEVVQTGYKMNDKIIRFAKVVVGE